jgi:hypothetical protein
MRKSISIGYPKQRTKELKIEFPGGMVTVHTGLTNREGQAVVHVSVTPDGQRFAGEVPWFAFWNGTGVDGGGCRIIQQTPVKGDGQ